MKGTACRVQGAEGDSETARLLSIDIKNRAENVMIVDGGNDLGRLARIGSVTVSKLFATYRLYQTLFQMTSTVQARLKPEVGFPDVLRAAFPCGSITGAPKHYMMELIAELENHSRAGQLVGRDRLGRRSVGPGRLSATSAFQRGDPHARPWGKEGTSGGEAASPGASAPASCSTARPTMSSKSVF